ncbi:hypothetical protein M0802_003531 [Mischocyttarus mexicanus]|nr:hypothetical protein M0802_003531 [Mischocyttarus mexicanus]
MDLIMLELYDVLFTLRYPEITKTNPDNISSTILSDKLANYYSQLGISVNKDILLGNCTLKEQLPTLTRLLKFMKKIHADSNEVSNSKEEQTVASLLKMHFAEDTDNLSNVSPKMSYLEAVKYFEDLRIFNEPNEFNETSMGKELSEFSENDEEANNVEKQKNFILLMEKLTDTFNSNPPSALVGKHEYPAVNSMDKDFKTMQSEFEIFNRMLHFKDEIPKLALPKMSTKIDLNKQSFNSIIQDIMTYTNDIIQHN